MAKQLSEAQLFVLSELCKEDAYLIRWDVFRSPPSVRVKHSRRLVKVATVGALMRRGYLTQQYTSALGESRYTITEAGRAALDTYNKAKEG